jgi:hypothetical protein
LIEGPVSVARTAGELAEQLLAASRTAGCAPIDGLLREDLDLAMVAEAFAALRASGAAVTLRLRKTISCHHTPMGVAFAGETTRLNLQQCLETLLRAKPKGTWRLAASQPPLALPARIAEAWLRTHDDVAPALSGIPSKELKLVVALAATAHGARAALPRHILKTLLAESLPEVLVLTDEGLEPLEPYKESVAKTLFIFPERMLPVTRAFYSRGFDLLSALNAQGVATDVLVFGPPAEPDLRRIEATLRLVAPRARALPLKRASLSRVSRAVRDAEAYLRRLVGDNASAPMRYSEREAFFCAPWQIARIAEAVLEGGYKRVIMTGAWSLAAITSLRRCCPELQVACDTHDVFFVADSQANAGLRRFLYSPRRQKARELAALAECDLVLAISPSDAESLRDAGLAAPMVVESGTFEHARVDPAVDPDPACFGYIGTANAQNRMALDTLRTEWWPAIRRAMPEARLLIAGPACKTPEAQQLLAESPDRVELVGFVRDLRDFYVLVRTMLSPIAIQGGLNFKSVEALVAGRELVTTELGSRCIGPRVGVWVADRAAEVEAAVARIAAGPNGPDRRRDVQEDALRIFGEAAGFRALAGWASGKPARPETDFTAHIPMHTEAALAV